VNIVQITPGAGKMFCGGCFRDNALVAELRKLGHSVTMVPLYLPLTLEDDDQSAGTPIFFSGINVYLEQKSASFRKAPRWFHRLLSSPFLLKMVAGSAAKTRPQDLGELTLSMLRGEEGNQAQELHELISWLEKNEKPDVISLSNVLLAGMARKLKSQLNVPVVCSLQGEDSFLDALPEGVREKAWQVLAERAAEIDSFIAPSFYFADLMSKRLKIPRDKIKVIYNGISLEGFQVEVRPSTLDPRLSTPTLGYFARMCREKGLPMLVDVFIELHKRGRIKNLKLKAGGSCGPADEAVVQEQRNKLKAAGILQEVEFHPNLNRDEKIKFLESLTVFSVPAMYGEAFGLYLIEAMASGVPVVQPRHAAFPEILRVAPGGVIAEPTVQGLVTTIEELLLDAPRLRRLHEIARKSVGEKFSVHRMASEIAQVFRQAVIAAGQSAKK
jgi:glycosyltransferase involved in cell wall biosynthesis